ncbi:Plasmodium vivax Vir protein/Plasmodium variant antigen protein Cir/Yir/Bir, putative [Plasmodium ovale]|uniref:Plasmodium vivax Vir protein/Plasmodium variant antigen protein Cir/Yir/Bir, putative n=1 Tax=Plasmodium ovale TaxID=36330 RepID=A0A1C3KI14_PLAOA|nr:Plasmodium vivax Vir protein/Plasmodium variant antigen protein Cir/Yir/Bir, putative [Plasmodium ovale]
MTATRETIYNVVGSFSVYKNILDILETDDSLAIIDECTEFNSNQYLKPDSDNINTCQIAVKYLTKLKENGQHSYKDKGCKYFYKWIYGKVKDSDNAIEHTLKICNELFIKYNENEDFDIFQEYRNNMSKEFLEKLVKLFNLHDDFDKFKNNSTPQDDNCNYAKKFVRLYEKNVKECHVYSDSDFCNELENIKEDYENIIKTKTCPHDIPKILPSTRGIDHAILILIPFFIILITSFILFISYKFTPFGLRFHRNLIWKKEICSNIYQETDNLYHTADISNRISQGENYRIAYPSV